MKIKFPVIIVAMTFLLSGCSHNTSTSSSELISSDTISSTPNSSESVTSSSTYTSIKVERFNPLTDEVFESIIVTDVETITKIDDMITKMVTDEKDPKKPKMPAQGGINYYVHFYEDDKMIDVYNVAGKCSAKKGDGKYVEWYSCSDDIYDYLKSIVIPNEISNSTSSK